MPGSLRGLLGEFRCCFTAPTFVTFCALAVGFLAATGRRTVCGMLVGAGLSRVWSHHRAHRFFSHARWSPLQFSVVLARLVVAVLVPDGAPITVAVDDTLFRRRGPKVHAASWFHDGSAQGKQQVGFGNNWVIAAVVVRLPVLDRPLALPVGFALVRKGCADSRLELGRWLVEQLHAAVIDCLWYGVFGRQQVQVVLIRERGERGYDIALVSTDLAASAAQLVERYAARWSIEIAIEDAKQSFGVGQARNRVHRAVQRTVPFTLAMGSLTICWYATAGHHPDDVTAARARAPWYRSKTQPSVADMLAKLRRVIIAAQFRLEDPARATPLEINTLRLAWADTAA